MDGLVYCTLTDHNILSEIANHWPAGSTFIHICEPVPLLYFVKPAHFELQKAFIMVFDFLELIRGLLLHTLYRLYKLKLTVL